MLPDEIRIHQTLQHPNIVEFQGHIQDERHFYIFMELSGTEWLISSTESTKVVFQTASSTSLTRDNQQSKQSQEIPYRSPESPVLPSRDHDERFDESPLYRPITLDICTGSSTSLYDFICAHNDSVPGKWIKPLFKNVADAVDYLHRQKIVHMDIKGLLPSKRHFESVILS
jgi:serine/threonine protein kinase